MPCDAFTKTEEILEITSYNANKLVNLLNQVYSAEASFSTKAISNAKELKEYFSCNWLINPMQRTEIDDVNANFWRSRNIAPQDTVFVKQPESKFFYNYLDFQSWKLKNSLELPVYLIEKGKKRHMIDIQRIFIKDDEEIIYVIRDGFYNKKKGVTFTDEEQYL